MSELSDEETAEDVLGLGEQELFFDLIQRHTARKKENMTTTEQTTFLQLLDAMKELLDWERPAKGDPQESEAWEIANQAFTAARADRALYEAARAMEKALETIALESALDDYATIRNIACAALPKE